MIISRLCVSAAHNFAWCDCSSEVFGTWHIGDKEVSSHSHTHLVFHRCMNALMLFIAVSFYEEKAN